MEKNHHNSSPGYLSLCYHYIRPLREEDPFPDIMCNRADEFGRQLDMLKNEYSYISLEDADRFSYTDFSFPSEKYGMLITLDDGLSDHWQAARILAERGIKATFFISTCILQDKLPANPPIMNYILAVYRIGGFLKAYRNALEEYHLPVDEYMISFEKGTDDPWEKIKEIKHLFKYRLQYKIARQILIHMYSNTFQKDFPDALRIMHLTEQQIRDIRAMGHAIGVHSRTHVSVGAGELTDEDFYKEIVEPKHYLENLLNEPVQAWSYPFGSEKDCLSSEALIQKTKEYRLAFTTNNIVNTKKNSPFDLGRYMPRSTDTASSLQNTLSQIIQKSG